MTVCVVITTSQKTQTNHKQLNRSNIMTWQLDKNKANKVGQSDFIRGNTCTTLKIISAAWLSTPNKQGDANNLSLDLLVQNENKNTTHINLMYGNTLGERWSNENMIHAIMNACNIPQLTIAQGQHSVFDFDSRAEQPIQANIAPELAGKFIGVYLCENWYVKDGQVKQGGVELFNVFDYKTQQFAWQKNAQIPATDEEAQKAFEAMLAKSEKNHAKACESIGINPNAHRQGLSNETTDGMPNKFLNNGNVQATTYQRTPVQPNQQQGFNQQGQASQNITPKLEASDDDIPF